MMRNLLVDRFQLKFPRELRDLPVYKLVVGKGGPKMKPSVTLPVNPSETPPAEHPIDLQKLKTGSDGFLEIPPGTRGIVETFMPGKATLTARRQTVKQLITMLADRVDRPILDMTSLPGDFDFNLIWSPESTDQAVGGVAPSAASINEPDAPQLFDALERQLGLKLIPKKASTDMMIVDSANKVPIDN